jgi:hypothetical protein
MHSLPLSQHKAAEFQLRKKEVLLVFHEEPKKKSRITTKIQGYYPIYHNSK